MLQDEGNKIVVDEKLKYPKSALVVLGHQAFERFSYWGIVVVLPLFLRNSLGFDDDSSTSMYHGFAIFGYLSAFVGATLADSFLGKFWTIVDFSFLYLLGTFLMTLSATSAFPPQWLIWIAVLGMGFTALASGSIKPCIIAFGGDQFHLPQQQKQLEEFFTILLLLINFVLLCTAILTPMIRGVACLGQNTCYPLTFGIPLVFVMIASVVFILGKAKYKHLPVKRNIVWDALKCFSYAIAEKRRLKKKLGRNKNPNFGSNLHWLDYSEQHFGTKFVQDLKRVLKLVVLFLPVTTFWSLFDQQFSRWTFQASRMNGNIMNDFVIKPDQVAIINFIFTFVLIPIFDKWVYPIMGGFGMLKTSLQRVICGCLLASVSFIICASVELKVEWTMDKLPSSSEAHLNVINFMSMPINVGLSSGQKYLNFTQEIQILSMENHIFREIPVLKIPNAFNLKISVYSGEDLSKNYVQDMFIQGKQGYTLLVYPGFGQKVHMLVPDGPDNLIKSLENNSKLKIICSTNDIKGLTLSAGKTDIVLPKCETGQTIELSSRHYFLKHENQVVAPVQLGTGGNYVFAIAPWKNNSLSLPPLIGRLYTVREPDCISMLWLLPQYLVMSIAEVLVEIPLTGFAYEQAPKDFKSLLQVVNLIPPALGGILVVILAKSKLFESQAVEFFFFAGVNVVSVLVLVYLAQEYKPLKVEANNVSTKEEYKETVGCV